MRRLVVLVSAVAALVLSQAVPTVASDSATVARAAAQTPPGTTTRVSVDSREQEANRDSSTVASSADGSIVAFSSAASNLVPGDTNNRDDVFVRDHAAGTTRRVSVSTGGRQGNGDSSPVTFGLAVSADGNIVAFSSAASNLVPGDTNDTFDIFVRDLAAATTTRVSVGNRGLQANGLSFRPAVSADGNIVAFASGASNLVPGDTNGNAGPDPFVGLDVFVRNRAARITSRVSVGSGGEQANGSRSDNPSVSADGNIVAFSSDASNLVPGDTNGDADAFRGTDVFVRDRFARTTARISVNSRGRQADGPSFESSVGGNGRVVAFASFAGNLVPGDTNNARDVFVRARGARTTSRVNVDGRGVQANGGNSSDPSVSADGNVVAFTSGASNLVPGDTNNANDVFVRHRAAATTTRVSVDSRGGQANLGSGGASISADANNVAFSSFATDLVPGDTNEASDVFLRDRGETPAAAP